jgi:hypothetical protein
LPAKDPRCPGGGGGKSHWCVFPSEMKKQRARKSFENLFIPRKSSLSLSLLYSLSLLVVAPRCAIAP